MSKTKKMKDLIDGIVRQIIADKREHKVVPLCASLREIQRELTKSEAIKQCMRALAIEGKYYARVDINGEPQLHSFEQL